MVVKPQQGLFKIDRTRRVNGGELELEQWAEEGLNVTFDGDHLPPKYK